MFDNVASVYILFGNGQSREPALFQLKSAHFRSQSLSDTEGWLRSQDSGLVSFNLYLAKSGRIMKHFNLRSKFTSSIPSVFPKHF